MPDVLMLIGPPLSSEAPVFLMFVSWMHLCSSQPNADKAELSFDELHRLFCSNDRCHVGGNSNVECPLFAFDGMSSKAEGELTLMAAMV